MIKVKNRSYRDDVERFKNHVHPVLGTIPMSEIRSIQLEQLFNKLSSLMAPATVNHVRALLHRMYEVAIRHDYVNNNPVKKTDRFKVDNVVNRIMTPQETERFIEECLKESNNPSAMALLCALLTSPRISNICELKWSQVSFTEKTMLLEHTKAGKKLLVPLSDEAIVILQMRMEFRAGEYVFSKDPAGQIPIGYPRTVFTRICKQAGISTTGALHEGREGFPAAPLTIHCLRKTNSSRLLQTHNDIYMCKELLGHSDVKVTERYSFYLSQQFKDAVQGLFQLPTYAVMSKEMH
jgi:integrase